MVWALTILIFYLFRSSSGPNLEEPAARRPAFGRLLAAASHVCEALAKEIAVTFPVI
jgi:hypothetical protein